jgi:hypothetical protein
VHSISNRQVRIHVWVFPPRSSCSSEHEAWPEQARPRDSWLGNSHSATTRKVCGCLCDASKSSLMYSRVILLTPQSVSTTSYACPDVNQKWQNRCHRNASRKDLARSLPDSASARRIGSTRLNRRKTVVDGSERRKVSINLITVSHLFDLPWLVLAVPYIRYRYIFIIFLFSNRQAVPQERKWIIFVLIGDVKMLESRPFHVLQMV